MANQTNPTSELLTNIEFLPINIKFTSINIERNIFDSCKYLSRNDFALILLLIKNPKPISLIIKLLKSVRIEPELGCWFRSEDWSHYTSVDKIPGHRLSFELFNGFIVNKREVCHHCDRKGCINPFHLFQGTHSKNMKDARFKGRMFPYKIGG